MNEAVCIEGKEGPRRDLLLPDCRAEGLLKIESVEEIEGSKFARFEEHVPIYLSTKVKKQRRRIICEVAEHLRHIHAEGYAYGWLSPDAIVSSNGTIKLHRHVSGTDFSYIAPELERHSVISPAADVYSLGRLLQIYLPEVAIWRLCLNEDPDQRPRIRQVIKALKNFSLEERRVIDRPWLTLKSALITSTAFIAILGLAVFFLLPIRSCLWILNREGFGAAYHFIGDFIHTEKAEGEILYDYAWHAFRDKEIEKARAICAELLKGPLSEETKANAHYLLGSIENELGNFAHAEAEFREALNPFEKAGNSGQVYRTTLGLARAALEQRKVEEAAELLEKASASPSFKAEQDLFFHLQSRLAFLRNDFPGALGHARKWLELAEVPGERARALGKVGFYLLLTGQPEEGFRYTQEAEVLAVETEDEPFYYHNLLNEILYDKCLGNDYTINTDAINRWAVEHKDKRLMDLIAFVLDFNCPALRMRIRN